MRFLSLFLLSGCAFLDAAGEADRGAFELSYLVVSVSANQPPIRALVFNNDGQGRPDLAVLGGDHELYVSTENAGVYPPPSLLSNSMFPGPYTAIAVGNVDGDGARDDLVGVGINKLTVFGSSAAKFDETTVVQNATPTAVTIGKFPFIQDPGLSVAIAYNDVDPPVLVLTALFPLGGSPAPSSLMGFSNPVALLTADTRSNDNGTQELVIAAGGGQLVEGVAQSSRLEPLMHTFAGTQFTHLVAGEFNAAEGADVAFARVEGGIGIVFGGVAGLGNTVGREIGAGLGVKDMAVGDVDGDGRDDLVVLTASEQPELHVFREISAAAEKIQIVPIEGKPTSVSLGDLDLDGRDDIVLVPGRDGGIDLLLSQ